MPGWRLQTALLKTPAWGLRVQLVRQSSSRTSRWIGHMAQPPTRHNQPARGAMAGIRADAKKAKDGGDKNPGVAWSHNFLNQKPWHPSNFRNQARVFEAEQRSAEAAKSNAIAKAEFEAEQEKLKQLSYLSAAEQKRFTDRQSIAFMYMKPPGYDAAQKKNVQVQEKGAVGQDERESELPDGPRGRIKASGGGRHVSNMLEAMSALQKQDRFEIKHMSCLGRKSPPRGGGEGTAANQQILVSSSDEDGEGVSQTAGLSHAKRQRLDEAEAFLKAAGISVPAILARSSKGSRTEKRKHKREKKKKAHKKSHKHSSSVDIE